MVNDFSKAKSISQDEVIEILKPICREIDDFINKKNIQFESGIYNETNGTYNITLKVNKLHFASRGIRDSIGDIQYEHKKIKIGLRIKGIPTNIHIDLI